MATNSAAAVLQTAPADRLGPHIGGQEKRPANAPPGPDVAYRSNCSDVRQVGDFGLCDDTRTLTNQSLQVSR